ncbi:MAG: CoA-binding protein [Bacteroidetes bacterium GWF2_38_335]|nr:MAG: CoA-binding protein [Bacteroidetes bacterium GWF2_38_335]OFY77305.1 MAG: CoA-binding protein [Bacteroidetes bacterium RIFOXYA12_FULL_38_20]HBS85720.1 CoA-binding protein [Bacteroidales bacterium]
MNQKTLVIGASEKPDRYSNMAVKSLQDHGYGVVALGARHGLIGKIEILTGKPIIENIDTVTLYLSPANQKEYYSYIADDVKPQRVIFNPGTENMEFMKILERKGINCVVACTLVMLSTDQF